MLNFRWKCKKLEQIDVIEESWNSWDIFTGLDPRLSHVPKWRPRQRKRTVVITLNMVNMVSILIVLKAQTLSGKRWNSISKHLNFKIFWRACPQTPLGSSRLRRSKSSLPPTFPARTSTSKLIDSTAIAWNTCYARWICLFLIEFTHKLRSYLYMWRTRLQVTQNLMTALVKSLGLSVVIGSELHFLEQNCEFVWASNSLCKVVFCNWNQFMISLDLHELHVKYILAKIHSFLEVHLNFSF